MVSFCKTLTDSVAFAQRYEKGWGYTAEALIKLLDRPSLAPDTSTTDGTITAASGGAATNGTVTSTMSITEEIQEQDVDDLNFDTGFTQLNTCRRRLVDPWPQIGDLKSWVGAKLSEGNMRTGGKVCLIYFISSIIPAFIQPPLPRLTLAMFVGLCVR